MVLETCHPPTPNLRPLPRPLHRKWQHQIPQRQARRWPACQDCLDDVRRQQRQSDHPTHKRRTDLLRPRDFVQASIGAALQQFLSAKCPRNRLDYRVVDGGDWRRVSVSSIRQYDHLAPATLPEGHWQINGNDISNHHAAFLPGITDWISSRMPAVFMAMRRPVGLTVTRCTSS